MKELRIVIPLPNVTGLSKKAGDLIVGLLTRVKKAVPKPTKSSQVTYKIKVAGTTKSNSDGTLRQDIIASLKGDEIATIILDNENQYDRNAIRVNIDGKLIGWIPAQPPKGWSVPANLMIRDKLNAGKKVEVLGWVKLGGTNKYPRYGIELRIRNDR